MGTGHKKHLCEIWKAKVNHQPFLNALKGAGNSNSAGRWPAGSACRRGRTAATPPSAAYPLQLLEGLAQECGTQWQRGAAALPRLGGVRDRRGFQVVLVGSRPSLPLSVSFSAQLPDCWPGRPTATSGLIRGWGYSLGVGSLWGVGMDPIRLLSEVEADCVTLHQQGMKTLYFPHCGTFRGEESSAPAGRKWLFTARERVAVRGPGFCCGWGRGCAWACVVQTSCQCRWGGGVGQAFQSACPNVGQKWKEDVKAESWQQANLKQTVTLVQTLPQWLAV